MFDGIHTYPRISERLRQDMMPASPRPTPSPPPQPKAAPEPVISQPPSRLNPPAPELVEEFVPQVETASFVENSAPVNKAYLSWLAVVLLVPSLIFWFLSILYVAGATAPLRAIITTVPFALIVLLNTAMPLVAMGLGLLVIFKTSAGEAGRLIAKFAAILSGVCLLALIFWLVAEAI